MNIATGDVVKFFILLLYLIWCIVASIKVTLAIASFPGSPIFSTHTRKEGEPEIT